MYRDIRPDLLHVLEPIARGHGLELVDASLSGGRGRARLLVVLDTSRGDGRVTVGECAAVSREIGHALDAEEVIAGSYVLEVASPGVDRTLAREVDFERVVGRDVALETREPLDGRRRFRGRLVSFCDEAAEVSTESGSFRIPFALISRARAFEPHLADEKR
jgi:ribosome maturation factor RimP